MGQGNRHEVVRVHEKRLLGCQLEDGLGQEADQRQHGEAGDQTVALSPLSSGQR